MTETKVRPAATHTGQPRIEHCEDRFAPEPNVALCGKKLLGIDPPADSEKCVVCVDVFTRRFRKKP